MKILPIFVLLASTLLLAAPATNAAPPVVKDLTQEPNGVFTFHGIKFQLQHNDSKWRATRQGSVAQVNEPVTADDGTKYTGTIPVPEGAALSFEETLTPGDADHFTVSYKVDLPPEVTTNVLCLAFDLPAADAKGQTIVYDGTSMTIPETFEKQQLLARQVSTVSIPTADGRISIEGQFGCVIQDSRKWNKDSFEFHCGFPGRGEPSRELTLTFRFEPK